MRWCEAIQAENAFAASGQMVRGRAAHRAQPNDDDIKPGRHFVIRESARISANPGFFYSRRFALFADLFLVFTSRFHSSLSSAPKLINTPTSSPVAFR